MLALDDVSLDVGRGEFVALLGPVGVRQEHAAQHHRRPARSRPAGTVTVGEHAGARPAAARDGVRVPREHALAVVHGARELPRLARIPGPTGRLAGARAGARCDRSGWSNSPITIPRQLSVGMKQRINLARGICLETEILLMDEPFAALDEQTRLVLGEDLSVLLARTGKTIVFVTHSLAEAVFLADRIVVMTARPGKIKAMHRRRRAASALARVHADAALLRRPQRPLRAAARRDPPHRRRDARGARRAPGMTAERAPPSATRSSSLSSLHSSTGWVADHAGACGQPRCSCRAARGRHRRWRDWSARRLLGCGRRNAVDRRQSPTPSRSSCGDRRRIFHRPLARC